MQCKDIETASPDIRQAGLLVSHHKTKLPIQSMGNKTLNTHQEGPKWKLSALLLLWRPTPLIYTTRTLGKGAPKIHVALSTAPSMLLLQILMALSSETHRDGD